MYFLDPPTIARIDSDQFMILECVFLLVEPFGKFCDVTFIAPSLKAGTSVACKKDRNLGPKQRLHI